ncbi:MAG TPA: redoxin domain-containing protein, partial [Methylomirabilota bacterium]|nr:redoxin domain-containing protein [Methylomirabilota bacterium]
MPDFARLVPRAPVPPLRVGTVGGPCWRLCDQKPKHFTLVLFYRGLHCSGCRAQMKELDAKFEAFHSRGVSVLAVSADTRERAERTAADWGIERLTLCWGLTMDQARAWGLYISKGRGVNAAGIEEPDYFVEPAVFLVSPDGTLYAGMVQTMPFARPRLDDLLAAIDHMTRTGAAPRGVAARRRARPGHM